VTAMEDRVLAVIAAGPRGGSRFVDVLLALDDEQPSSVFSTLRTLARDRQLVDTGTGTVERPRVPRYRIRRSA
jgi:hypothetical protein